MCVCVCDCVLLYVPVFYYSSTMANTAPVTLTWKWCQCGAGTSQGMEWRSASSMTVWQDQSNTRQGHVKQRMMLQIEGNNIEQTCLSYTAIAYWTWLSHARQRQEHFVFCINEHHYLFVLYSNLLSCGSSAFINTIRCLGKMTVIVLAKD